MPDANDYNEAIIWGVHRPITELTADVITSIYLYGSETPPEYFGDRIRDTKPNFKVKINIEAFFESGPGGVINPARFSAVEKFFDGDFSKPIVIVDGVEQMQFSGQELINKGVLSIDDFLLSIQHLFIHIGSNDYASRTYIYNRQSFDLTRETMFVWDENGALRLEDAGMFVASDVNDPDNFDFNTDNPLLQIPNLLLEDRIDPYGLGEDSTGNDVAIIFEYVGNPYLVTNSSGQNFYSLGDYTGDFAINALLDGGISEATIELGPLPIVPQLEANFTINFDEASRKIIYGTNDADNDTFPLEGQPIHYVGGAGDDDVFGTVENDYIEGNADDDVINGGQGGNDILVGGLGADTLIGRAGNDLLFGHEAVRSGGTFGGLFSDGVAGEAVIASAPAEDGAEDTADYSDAAGLFGDGITLDTTSLTAEQLAAGFLIVTDDAQGGADILHSIEKIIATGKDDTFIFTGDLTTFPLVSIDGGAGTDTIDFTGASAGIDILELAAVSIERVLLTGFADYMELEVEPSSGQAIVIDGGGADDDIYVSGTGAGRGRYLWRRGG